MPRLVDTGRGLSVLFNERYLYSRFDPSKNSLNLAQQTVIPTETLVLCISPLLGYGLDLLLEKLPPSSFILALESNEQLMALSAAQLNSAIIAHPSFKYIRTSSSTRVLETIQGLPTGPFRRCLRINLSGGVSIDSAFYNETVCAIDEYISRYWRNHLTLMKLGRNYARNLFRNCALLPSSFQLPKNSSTLPVFVAGAGPSLDSAFTFLRSHRNFFFLLAVDTALGSLKDEGLVPDAVVVVESQFWIERAFSGCRGTHIPIYADLTARTEAITATGGPIHFFFSQYADTSFIHRFISTGFAPEIIPPMGSVGLVALHLARIIAKQNVPIFFTGLDFSYGNGFTHSKGAPSVRDSFNNATRFFPTGNENACFAAGVFKTIGKQNKTVFTDPSLEGYARLCFALFGNTNETEARIFYDLGQIGLQTGCTPISGESATELCEKVTSGKESRSAIKQIPFISDKNVIHDFLEREKSRLTELKNILCGITTTDANEEKIKNLVLEMDYLYTHFPDGYKGYSGEKNFLKRVRLELEYFLKTLEHRDTMKN